MVFWKKLGSGAGMTSGKNGSFPAFYDLRTDRVRESLRKFRLIELNFSPSADING